MVVRSCPRCSTPVDIPAGQRPVCPQCGFGAPRRSPLPLVLGLALAVVLLGGGWAWWLAQEDAGADVGSPDAAATTMDRARDAEVTSHPLYMAALFELWGEDDVPRTVEIIVRKDGEPQAAWNATAAARDRTVLGELRPGLGTVDVEVREQGHPDVHGTFDLAECADRSVRVYIVLEPGVDARPSTSCPMLSDLPLSDRPE